MRVHERMTRDPKCCRVQDSLAAAARLLAEHESGSVPVVDDLGRLHGILTDRDICVAGYTSGMPLHELKVTDVLSNVMARRIATTRPHASAREVEVVMLSRGVRRLLVLDDQYRVVGLFSCNDIDRWVDDGGADSALVDARLVRAIATVGCRRGPATRRPTPFERPARAPETTIPSPPVRAQFEVGSAALGGDAFTERCERATPSTEIPRRHEW